MSPKASLLTTTLCAAFMAVSACSEGSRRIFEEASPLPGSLILHPERIPLLEGGFFAAERGMAYLPVNRSDPGSGVLALEIYRFGASDAATPGTPPIFFLHGGPSFGGLESQLED